MIEAAIFLLKTVLGIFSLAFLLRFYLQIVRATPRNPLSIFVCAITDFAVIPARRFVPVWRGYDLSTFLLALLTEMLMLSMILILSGIDLKPSTLTSALAIFSLSVVSLAEMFVYIIIVVTFAQVILSWVNPYSPIVPLLTAMSSPFLDIFRRRFNPVGGVDLSPLFLLVTCQIFLIWPISKLYHSLLLFLGAS
ncbi:MAG: YggT family protein [Proteobacteria bacterium]|nr:YggT family protein [Pseudomonadota bacterium]